MLGSGADRAEEGGIGVGEERAEVGYDWSNECFEV